jgi:integrase
MARKRNQENLGLLPRWRFTNNAYYYSVPPGLEAQWDGKKTFRLGKDLTEAHQTYFKRVNADSFAATIKTIDELLSKYLVEEVPSKSPQYRVFNITAIKRLKRVFGNMQVDQIIPKDIYSYITLRSVKRVDPVTNRSTGGKTVAMREVEVLSAAYTKGVEWGLVIRHPFERQLRIKNPPGRDRYVTDAEFLSALSIESHRLKGSVRAIQAYLRIKLLTGMSRSDLLSLRDTEHITANGLEITRRKTRNTTGKKTVYQWTPELRQAVDLARQARPVDSDLLFCTREGHSFLNEEKGTAPGWKSMWQRFMSRLVKETGIEPFHDHDIRAKTASDATSLEHARALLSHSNSSTTKRFYRRTPESVKPLKTRLVKQAIPTKSLQRK